MRIKWPDGKKFAFTIFDDTDNAVLEDVKAVYDLLDELNLRTTKSVWVLPPSEKPRIGGEDLSNGDYLNYVQNLNKKGFEIGLHNATATHTKRNETKEAFTKFKEYFGHYPRTFANHADNRENVYWGVERLSGWYSYMLQLVGSPLKFEGHESDSPYFWGDLCKEHVSYVRNFIFKNLNTGASDPYMPYHDPQKPFVNNWFSSTDAAQLDPFLKKVNKKSIDRLERENGYAIIYTHFCSFASNGKVNAEFKKIMQYLSEKDGWYVPVATLLDFLNDQKSNKSISRWQRKSLERKWFWQQVTKRLLG